MKQEYHIPTSSFTEEIAALQGGELIEKCIQCGICTASCEVARVSERYHPRKLIQKILIGKRKEVLESDLPWLCMTCRLCEERCQEGVSPADIFRVVRTLAAKEGFVPKVFANAVDLVLRDGWLLAASYSDFIEDSREDMGLDADLHWDDTFVQRLKAKFLGGA